MNTTSPRRSGVLGILVINYLVGDGTDCIDAFWDDLGHMHLVRNGVLMTAGKSSRYETDIRVL